jgi:hypothetical protein
MRDMPVVAHEPGENEPPGARGDNIEHAGKLFIRPRAAPVQADVDFEIHAHPNTAPFRESVVFAHAPFGIHQPCVETRLSRLTFAGRVS